MAPSARTPPTLTFHVVAERVARRQHGVVTRGQLLEAGLAAHIVDQRVRSGVLRAIHRGVYLMGPITTPDSHLMAACLACGRTAVISHESAGVRWGVLHRRGAPEKVEVSVPARAPRRPGVRVHRRRNLPARDCTRLDGIPITTPSRTLLDLAPLLPDRELERAVAEVLARRLVARRALRAAARRYEGLPGAGRLREALGVGAPARTRSEAEERLLALVRAGGLPEPRVNVRVGRYEVDFFWPEARLVVETDGFAFHGSRRSFDRDRRRDQRLMARGIRVMRFTWRQIELEPGEVLRDVMRALARSGG